MRTKTRKTIHWISFLSMFIFVLLSLFFNYYLFFMLGWVCSITVIVTHDWVYPIIKNIYKIQKEAIPKRFRLK